MSRGTGQEIALLAPALILTALAAVGLACSGKAPVSHVWSLRLPNSQAPAPSERGPRLGINRFSAVAELRTTVLTWREGDERELKRYSYHAWSDYPDRLLQELCFDAFLATLGYPYVEETLNPAYRLFLRSK